LQENSTADQIAKARESASKADVVLACMYGRVRSGARNSVGPPDSGVSILRELLASNKKVVGASFGNPYILGAFPEMKTYVVAYGDMPSLQRAAARGIFGMQSITGHLPISLPGLYPRGTGIPLLIK
jgi:beta-N-acetylhexosaminidase